MASLYTQRIRTANELEDKNEPKSKESIDQTESN